MALLGIELETLVSKSDALTTRPPPIFEPDAQTTYWCSDDVKYIPQPTFHMDKFFFYLWYLLLPNK